MIGQTLAGQYEIVRQLGSGGMGAVYEARSKSDERVAIKVISTGDIAKDKALVGRFHREAKAATGIDTDHIVRVLATGTDEANDQPFMVMEYLVGEDLHHLFHRLGPLVPELAMRIIAQAAVGLGKAHDAHVVHRDIKPANIYLAEWPGQQRIVKLLDFGIAKIKMDKANATDTTGLTRTGSMLGSPLYMSPEQARGSKSIDHRADIWSLGIVFYQALTGKTPNQDIDALGELIIAICSEPPRPVQELAPWVPPEVAQILHKTLRFDPAERYQTAQELYEALAPLLPGGVGIGEAMLTPMTAEARAVKAERASIPPGSPLARSGGARNSVMPPDAIPPSSHISASGTVRADGGTNAGLAQSPSTARPRTSSTRLPMLLGATALVGAGLAYVLYMTMRPAPVAVVPGTAAAAVAEPAPTAPAPRRPSRWSPPRPSRCRRRSRSGSSPSTPRSRLTGRASSRRTASSR